MIDVIFGTYLLNICKLLYIDISPPSPQQRARRSRCSQ